MKNNLNPLDIWGQLLRFGKEKELPKFFKNDLLIHDYNTLTEDWQGQPFVWSLRETGTHLTYIENIQDYNFLRMLVRIFQPEYTLFFDGKTMEEVPVRDLLEIVFWFIQERRK